MKTVKMTNLQQKTRVFCGLQNVLLNNLSTLTILTCWEANVLPQIYLLTCRKLYNSIGKYCKLQYIDSTKLINSKTIIITVQ